MNGMDKMLLGLMVVMLPIGLYFSYRLFSGQDILNPSQAETTVDAQQLNQAITELQNRAQAPAATPKPEFVIGTVSYASESGTIKIEGNAPSSEAMVMMSVTVLPPATPTPTPGSVPVLGNKVEQVAVRPSANGTFVVEYPVNPKDAVVELRLEQDEAIRTVRFDIQQKRQLL